MNDSLIALEMNGP